MSKVTVKVIEHPAPAPITQPRVVELQGQKYTVRDGDLHVFGWDGVGTYRSAWNDATTLQEIARSDRGRALVELLRYPTETIAQPAPEPTVVLEMPKSYAIRLRDVVGQESDKITGHIFMSLLSQELK